MLLEQSQKETAYAEYNAASLKLELCIIRQRNAELETHSIAKMHDVVGDITEREKSIGLAFARYAVYGRVGD